METGLISAMQCNLPRQTVPVPISVKPIAWGVGPNRPGNDRTNSNFRSRHEPTTCDVCCWSACSGPMRANGGPSLGGTKLEERIFKRIDYSSAVRQAQRLA
jgi:hypothetical protein